MMQLCGLDDQVWRSRSGVVLTRPVRARCPPGRRNRSDAGVSPVTVGQQRAPVPAIGFGPRDSPKLIAGLRHDGRTCTRQSPCHPGRKNISPNLDEGDVGGDVRLDD